MLSEVSVTRPRPTSFATSGGPCRFEAPGPDCHTDKHSQHYYAVGPRNPTARNEHIQMACALLTCSATLVRRGRKLRRQTKLVVGRQNFACRKSHPRASFPECDNPVASQGCSRSLSPRETFPCEHAPAAHSASELVSSLIKAPWTALLCCCRCLMDKVCQKRSIWMPSAERFHAT